jgi:lipopolysaccharide/colanic/teichoic acid biosynthesis glycosyltransferase
MRDPNLKKGLPRVVEVSMAMFGLVVTGPILAVFALLIKLGSPGPVLFRQPRMGRGGKTFTLLKLRTMVVGESGTLVTAANDARITSTGKVLRRTKIDELPELWNVVRGDMSIVGPRPEVPALVDTNNPLWVEILKVRPGLTDPVTLRLRNEEQLLASAGDDERFYADVLQPYKLRGYLHFVRNRTWKTDISIIYRTLKAIVFPQTAAPPSKEELRWSLAE